MGTLEETYTWDLFLPKEELKPLGCRRVFKITLNSYGLLDKPKSRLVAKGYEQKDFVNFVETYSQIVRTTTVKAVLYIFITQK